MGAHKFSSSIPRKQYWSDEVGGLLTCPDCGGKLQEDSHSYVMAISQGRDCSFQIVGSRGGYFCPGCTVVVLDSDEFNLYANAYDTVREGSLFTVLGILDLSAIPDEKKHLAFDDDNPLPLVEFTNLKNASIKSYAKHPGKRKRKKPRKKKR